MLAEPQGGHNSEVRTAGSVVIFAWRGGDRLWEPTQRTVKVNPAELTVPEVRSFGCFGPQHRWPDARARKSRNALKVHGFGKNTSPQFSCRY